MHIYSKKRLGMKNCFSRLCLLEMDIILTVCLSKTSNAMAFRVLCPSQSSVTQHQVLKQPDLSHACDHRLHNLIFLSLGTKEMRISGLLMQDRRVLAEMN